MSVLKNDLEWPAAGTFGRRNSRQLHLNSLVGHHLPGHLATWVQKGASGDGESYGQNPTAWERGSRVGID